MDGYFLDHFRVFLVKQSAWKRKVPSQGPTPMGEKKEFHRLLCIDILAMIDTAGGPFMIPQLDITSGKLAFARPVFSSRPSKDDFNFLRPDSFWNRRP